MAITIDSVPRDPEIFMQWSWGEYEPYVNDLQSRPLTAQTVEDFLSAWSVIADFVEETDHRLYLATACNTADEAAERAYHRFREHIYLRYQQVSQTLREKLLASGLCPPGFDIPLAKMRAEAALFRPENLALLNEERTIEESFNKITGAQTVEWDGEELTVTQLSPLLERPDREIRERAWQARAARQLADREALNALWRDALTLRCRLAANAGLPDYRTYRWRQMLRFDYTPEDCLRFDAAIAEVVVPAAGRILARRRTQLGVASLRPWDLAVDPLGRPPLRPFAHTGELVERTLGVFSRLDSAFADSFRTMIDERLLDLETRKNKGAGGFCTTFPVVRRPFIFMNGVGVQDDVETLAHESGHAFHTFETTHLPWNQQRDVGLEFSEVASTAMELLTMPYLADPEYGFYDAGDAARAVRNRLERAILFWPYMAIVDSFQQWAYTHPDDAADPAACDRVWSGLYRRFRPDEDWSGLDEELMTGWQRRIHIYSDPFYYVEYGLAQLGAVQIWANARLDQPAALARYRQALALGGTHSIPDLYAAAGARFSFDPSTLREAVTLIEAAIAELYSSAPEPPRA